MALSKKQIGLMIHVAKARLDLDDEEYRAVLLQEAGVETSKALDVWGFEAVMDRFATLGFKSGFRARSWGERPGMASAAQVELIRALWREFMDGEAMTPRSANGWTTPSRYPRCASCHAARLARRLPPSRP